MSEGRRKSIIPERSSIDAAAVRLRELVQKLLTATSAKLRVKKENTEHNRRERTENMLLNFCRISLAILQEKEITTGGIVPIDLIESLEIRHKKFWQLFNKYPKLDGIDNALEKLVPFLDQYRTGDLSLKELLYKMDAYLESMQLRAGLES